MRLPWEINEAGNIVVALDHFPLALDQAGAYIEETKCRFVDYLEAYQSHRKELLARRGTQATNYPDSVATTWSLSFQKVKQANPAAVELLRLCAFLAPDKIPEELIKNGASHWSPLLQIAVANLFAFNQMIGELLKFSLVKRLTEDRMLSIHRLVQAVLQDTMTEQERKKWAEQTVQAVNAAMRNIETGRSSRPTTLWEWSQYRERYLPHLRLCAMLIERWQVISSEAAELLNEFAHHLHMSVHRGSDDELADALQKAAIMWEKVCGPDDLHIADCLHSLAVYYYFELQRTNEAEALFKRVSSIIERHNGSEDLEKFEFRIKVIRAL